MPDKKVTPHGRVFNLGGSADTDIEGLDPDAVDVSTTDKNLADAQKAYPNYDWFIDFNVRVKNSSDYSTASYTLKFNKPASGKIYAYYNKTLHELTPSDAGTKGGRNRVQVTWNVGDPAIGRG